MSHMLYLNLYWPTKLTKPCQTIPNQIWWLGTLRRHPKSSSKYLLTPHTCWFEAKNIILYSNFDLKFEICPKNTCLSARSEFLKTPSESWGIFPLHRPVQNFWSEVPKERYRPFLFEQDQLITQLLVNFWPNFHYPQKGPICGFHLSCSEAQSDQNWGLCSPN